MKKQPDKLWFPSLLQVANNINTNSWFDMTDIKNQNNKSKMIKRKIPKVINYTKCIKIPIYPNNKQKEILSKWFLTIQQVYNITNSYLKLEIKKTDNIEELLNFYNIRKTLQTQLQAISKKTGVNKHTIDYSVKHCISMYKSCNSNLERNNISEYNIKDLDINKNRYNLVIEPISFSKKINGFFVNTLGHMNSQRSLKNIFKQNCILQYHKNTNKYFIIAPMEKENILIADRYKNCGIDLGVRTFATIYSPEKVLEVGNNITPILNRYHNKMDNIKSEKAKGFLKEKLYKKLLERYGCKMRNRILDLHKKLSVFLTSTYKEITIGKMSTSRMVSNKTSNIKAHTKRQMMTLSFYKFNEFLGLMAKKYDCKINIINEYNTTKICHLCKTKNETVGSKKIFKCCNKDCKIELGRDVNASINIYNGGFLTVKPVNTVHGSIHKIADSDIL